MAGPSAHSVSGRFIPAAVALFVLLRTLTGAAADVTAPKDVYEPGKVWTVHILLSAEEYAAIEPRAGRGFPGFGPPGFGPPAPATPEKPLDPDREVHRNTFGFDLPWGTGSVTVGDKTYEKVGIRYKGNGTILDASRSIKKSIKIDLDREGGEGRFAGSKTINLHCGVTDPSKCRESLGYEVYGAAGVPSPRTAFAEVRLTVPGKYDNALLGLYTIVEEIDKPFLRDRFGDDKGLLMKPEGVRDFTDMGDEWERYKRPYEPKRDAKPDEAKRMIAFARLVDRADDATFRKEIDSYLDVDNYLRFLATTSFVSSTDSIFTGGHNYYLYLHPVTRKLHFLPWDLDRAFANFGNAAQNMDLSLLHPYGGTHKLTDRLLATPEIAATYQKLLKELAAGPFAKERLQTKLARFEETSRGPRERDTQAAAKRQEGPGPGGFGGGMFGAPPELPAFIETRTASVAAQLAGTSKGFVPQGFGPFGFGGPGFGMGTRAGDIFSGPQQDQLKLTAEQKQRLAEIQKETDARVQSLLTEEQKTILKGLRNPAPPGGPGGPGAPGGFRPPGAPGGFGPPAGRPGEAGAAAGK